MAENTKKYIEDDQGVAYLINSGFSTNITAYGTGGSSGDGGGEMLEPRVAKLESHVERIQADVKEIKEDVREIRKYGIGAFLVTWGGIITAYLLLTTALNDNSDKIDAQISETRSEFNSQFIEVRSTLSDMNKTLSNIDKRIAVIENK